MNETALLAFYTIRSDEDEIFDFFRVNIGEGDRDRTAQRVADKYRFL